MPRAGLTSDVVVARAGELADRDGYDALTLANHAGRLGVKVPSLYKHVSSLADLQRRLRLAGLRGLDEALRTAAVGRAGTGALLATGHAYRHYAREHPGHYAAGLRAPGPGDSGDSGDPDRAEVVRMAARLTDLMLAVVGGYGLGDDDAVHAVRSVRAALHGFVALERAEGFGLPQDVDTSFEHLLATLDLGLRHRGSGRSPQ